MSVQAAGLLANEVYSVKFADGNDVAHGVACSKAASIAGVQSDGSGSVASTYAFLPTSAQQNGNGLICFVHAPRNEETTPAVSIAVRSVSEVKVSDDGGGGQTTTSGSVAASALRVVLTDASNNPVHGYVTFSAPSSGPSATFAPIDPDGSPGRSIRVITGDDGAGVSSPFTAGSAGAYVVAATAEGTSSSVNFAETNSPPISQGGGC